MGKNNNDIALCNEVDTNKVRQLQRRIDKNSDIIDNVVNRLVSSYCEQLDTYMIYVRNILANVENPPTDKELEDFVLNLPVLLYFAGEGQESLGIKEDVAKAVRQELYNETYEKATGTIADKTASAELATQAEFITQIAYSRAYKKIKLRCEAANETLQSAKKIISRRISEYEMSKVAPERIGGR